MKKKVLCLFLALFIIFCISAFTDAEEFTVGDWVLLLENGTASISRYIGHESEITVPTNAEILGQTYRIRTVGDGAFEDCTYLTKVTIPEGIATLGHYAFRNCTMLARLEILGDLSDGDARSVKGNGEYYASERSINNSIFYNTGKNADSFTVIFGEEVTRIPAYLFATSPDKSEDVYAHVTDLVIGNRTAEIGEYAFYRCFDLKQITFGDELSGIGKSAFGDNTSLTEISFNQQLLQIGENAFSGNTRLSMVNFNPRLVTIHAGAFENCSSLISLEFPESVATIDSYAFQNCTRLSSVTIHGKTGTQVRLGDGAFRHCTGLSELMIDADIAPCKAESMGSNREYYAVNRSENNSVFYDTGKNSDSFHVVFSDRVSSIPAYLFASSPDKADDVYAHLTGVAIGENVREIGAFAFARCYSLGELTLGKQVSIIGEKAFLDDSSLEELVFNENLFRIGDYAFSGNIGLRQAALNPKLSEIGKGAFSGCTALLSMMIPDSVMTIGDYAFENCTRLSGVRINGLAGIEIYLGCGAFRNCTAMTSVIINADISDCRPESVKGNGEYYASNRTENNSVFYNTGNNAEPFTVIFTEPVSRIPAYLFASGQPNSDDVYSHITSVVIGNSVHEIGDYAFYRCFNLDTVIMGNLISFIGENAFGEDNLLTQVRYAGETKEWGDIDIGANNDFLVDSSRDYEFDPESEISSEIAAFEEQTVVWTEIPEEENASLGTENTDSPAADSSAAAPENTVLEPFADEEPVYDDGILSVLDQANILDRSRSGEYLELVREFTKKTGAWFLFITTADTGRKESNDKWTYFDRMIEAFGDASRAEGGIALVFDRASTDVLADAYGSFGRQLTDARWDAIFAEMTKPGSMTQNLIDTLHLLNE